MAPKKSIFRSQGAQHFQLVHRSQRDPLINDPDAPQRVFKPITRANDLQKDNVAVTLADLEATVDKSSIRPNEGEASAYGIHYDDSAYDYMSHLRPVGGGGDSFLIEGPTKKDKGKGKAKEMFDLPSDVLPSKNEITQHEAYASQSAIPLELQGLQPDMDPHLRQVLEALEDDAFVDDQGEEDWFDELLGDGERDDYEDDPEWEFREEGIDEEYEDEEEQGGESQEGGDGTWEERFAAFKKASKEPRHASELDPEERSEMADTIGSLASNLGDLMVSGGKKRRGKRGPSDATGMSMSSSSMFRNSGLRTLDERFDKVERDYELEDDDDDFPDDDDVSIAPSMMSSFSRTSSIYTGSSPPKVSREDFDSIMDDFLDNYEVVGNRMQQSLGGTALSGPEKLAVLRAAMDDGDEGIGKEENRRRILELERLGRKGFKEEKEKMPLREVEGDVEKWDCETILTTYTNTENHPAVIRTRTAAQLKARAERQAQAQAQSEVDAQSETQSQSAQDSDSGSETETEERYTSVSRPKGETSEQRRARKAAVKNERSARRAEKKSHKETFTIERKKQLNSHKKMVGGGRAADLNVARGGLGVVSLS